MQYVKEENPGHAIFCVASAFIGLEPSIPPWVRRVDLQHSWEACTQPMYMATLLGHADQRSATIALVELAKMCLDYLGEEDRLRCAIGVVDAWLRGVVTVADVTAVSDEIRDVLHAKNDAAPASGDALKNIRKNVAGCVFWTTMLAGADQRKDIEDHAMTGTICAVHATEDFGLAGSRRRSEETVADAIRRAVPIFPETVLEKIVEYFDSRDALSNEESVSVP